MVYDSNHSAHSFLCAFISDTRICVFVHVRHVRVEFKLTLTHSLQLSTSVSLSDEPDSSITMFLRNPSSAS